MTKLVVLYKTPSAPEAFDAHYFSTHAPLTKQIPGLLNFEVSTGPVTTPAGASPYHLVAVLSFESTEALRHGVDSPEGKAAAKDLDNFAQAGVELLMFDTKEV